MNLVWWAADINVNGGIARIRMHRPKIEKAKENMERKKGQLERRLTHLAKRPPSVQASVAETMDEIQNDIDATVIEIAALDVILADIDP